MPGGVLVTVPFPLLLTVSVNGPLIANDNAFDVPPPGAALTTVIGTLPGLATSPAPIAAVSCVELTNVVVRAALFQRTTDPDTKLVPLTVSVNADPPAVALLGTSEVSVGRGFASSSAIVRTAVLGLPSVAPPVGLLSVTLTVSFASTSVSFRIGMVTVLFAVSPAAKLTVWLTAV